MFIAGVLIVLNNLILNFLLIFKKLWIYNRCLNCKLKDSLKKKILVLNLNEGLEISCLNILKKKRKYFS